MVRWNVDKRYLRVLERCGVPVVPTVWIEDERTEMPAEAWHEIVVKPAISAGSKDTARLRRSQGASIDALIKSIRSTGRPVMVQPYVSSVDERGETALLFFGGVCSHAICKGPLLEIDGDLEEGLFREEDIEPRVASKDERALGERVLEALPFDRASLVYARTDVVRGDDGRSRVIEVELIEPSVFLQYDRDASDRFALSIAQACH